MNTRKQSWKFLLLSYLKIIISYISLSHRIWNLMNKVVLKITGGWGQWPGLQRDLVKTGTAGFYVTNTVTNFWTHLSMIWWKMALGCQTRLSEVALHYASIYPRNHSVSRDPSKCSFDSQNWSLAAQNSSWGRSICCWTTFASVMTAPGMLPVC